MALFAIDCANTCVVIVGTDAAAKATAANMGSILMIPHVAEARVLPTNF
jgi:hypothetical protein